jgi:hypothetical protein
MHPRLTARGPWLDHCGELPLIHRTLIRLKVENLPGERDPKPVWLWSSHTAMSGADRTRPPETAAGINVKLIRPAADGRRR